jgi:hypothetical protein
MHAEEYEKAKARVPLQYEIGGRESRGRDSVVGTVTELQAG